MESTGERNRIQVSQETADLLNTAGKSHWCLPRRDCVFAKGKGQLNTFWLDVRTDGGRSSFSESSTEKTHSISGEDTMSPSEVDSNRLSLRSDVEYSQEKREKRDRLVDWNTDMLLLQLKDIVAERTAHEVTPDPSSKLRNLELDKMSHSGTMMDELEEIIRLPQFEAGKKVVSSANVELDEQVRVQLRDYVHTLSSMYRDNEFHNFEHAR